MQHESILNYPDLFKRSFVCFSFGKVYNCTGWKLGYCIAPEILMKEFRKVHQFNCFSCNAPIQHAIANFLSNKKEYEKLADLFQQKRDFFQKAMQKTRFIPLASHGSYFQLYSYEKISEENEKDFATNLCKQYGVACIPVSAFYKHLTENKVVRFCFAKKEDTINEAMTRLSQLSN